MTWLDRLVMAIDTFLDIRQATFVWTRGLTGEGPATIQRSRRQADAGRDDLLTPAW